jgi:hypothetical protein
VGDYLLDRAIEQAKAPDRDGIRAVSGMFLGDLLYKKSGAVDVIALKRNVLKRAARHRKIVDAERPAKIRIRIADLADTKFADVVQAEGYVRARRVSAGNVYLLGTLTSQLHVPADKAKATAETLLGAALACPLEGRYELTKGFDLAKRWRSTQWEEESLNQVAAVPKEFRAPLVDWFAGALIEFDIDNTSITTHIELDVRPKKP